MHPDHYDGLCMGLTVSTTVVPRVTSKRCKVCDVIAVPHELRKASVCLADIFCLKAVIKCDHRLNAISLHAPDKLSANSDMQEKPRLKTVVADIAECRPMSASCSLSHPHTWSQLITEGGSTCKSTIASTTLSPVGSWIIAVDRRCGASICILEASYWSRSAFVGSCVRLTYVHEVH